MLEAEARLTAKLALEAEFARPLAQVLTSYVAAWEQSEGVVHPHARSVFLRRLFESLVHHYTRVVASMQGRDLDQDWDLDELAPALAGFLVDRARSRSAYIIESMDRDLAALLADVPGEKGFGALDAKADEKRPFSVGLRTRFQATAMQAYFKIRAKLRAMVNMETEEPAEQAMFEWVRRRRGNAELVKGWFDMQDERVRHSHSDAGARYGLEGLIPVEQPFELIGGRLMFPGDSSLGASLREIINCRCSSHYYARTPDGVTPLGLGTPSIPARRSWRPGDRYGQEIPIRATSVVTLNGRTRARVVLGDNQTIGTLSQPSPSTINVTVNGQVVARATHERGQITSITIADGLDRLGIDRLVRDSVAHSWARRARP